eukprot:SAG11_NODE_1508_length_4775_cov_1.760693_5_plen_126_part_00
MNNRGGGSGGASAPQSQAAETENEQEKESSRRPAIDRLLHNLQQPILNSLAFPLRYLALTPVGSPAVTATPTYCAALVPRYGVTLAAVQEVGRLSRGRARGGSGGRERGRGGQGRQGAAAAGFGG